RARPRCHCCRSRPELGISPRRPLPCHPRPNPRRLASGATTHPLKTGGSGLDQPDRPSTEPTTPKEAAPPTRTAQRGIPLKLGLHEQNHTREPFTDDSLDEAPTRRVP